MKVKFVKRKVNQYTGKRHEFIWEEVKSIKTNIIKDYEWDFKANLAVTLDLDGFESTNYIDLTEYNYGVWNEGTQQYDMVDVVAERNEQRKHCFAIYYVKEDIWFSATTPSGRKLYEQLTIEEVDDFIEDMELIRNDRVYEVCYSDSKDPGMRYYIINEVSNSVDNMYKSKEERLEAAELDQPPQTQYISKKKRQENA